MKIFSCKVIIVILMLTLSGCGSTSQVSNDAKNAVTDEVSNLADKDNQYVLSVKNGTLSTYPNIKIVDAFNNFFDSGKWKYFKSTDAKNIIEFTGYCMYSNTKVKATLQFILNNNSLEIGALTFNEVPQNEDTENALLEKVFEQYSLKNDTSGINNEKTSSTSTNSPKVTTPEQAVELAKKYGNKGDKTFFKYDHSDDINGVTYYVIHAYDSLDGHTATRGWYWIDINTGKIYTQKNDSSQQLVPLN